MSKNFSCVKLERIYENARLGNQFAIQCLENEAANEDHFAQGYLSVHYVKLCFENENKNPIEVFKNKATYYAACSIDKITEENSRQNNHATWILGYMYIRGWIPHKSADDGRKLLITAAKNENIASAQYELGEYYKKQDYQTALKWYQEAAVQGFVEAQTAIGKLYLEGIATPKGKVWLNPKKDNEVGVQFKENAEQEGENRLKKAAEKDPRARITLANFYLRDKNKNNLKEACKLLSLVSDNDHPYEQYLLAHTLRDLISAKDPKYKITSKILELFTNAANQGVAAAARELEEIYNKGEDKNAEKNWRGKAIELEILEKIYQKN